MGGITFDPLLPTPLLGLLAAIFAGLTVLAYRQLGKTISRSRNFGLMLFRLTGLGSILALLLQPSREQSVPPPRINRVTLIAVDTSRSMKQTDVEQKSRLEAAREILFENLTQAGGGFGENTRFYEFSTDAAAVSASLGDLKPQGESTRIHTSVASILKSLGAGEEGRALIVLSDGHDFELANPAKTGFMCRNRGVPIYAVPLGKQGKVRDASVRITSYQPYSYVKQKAKIAGAVRFVGCEFEDVTVQLIRKNEVVQTRRINAGENSVTPVEFEVVEPEIGQLEYEIRVLPLQDEVNNENNAALTYLNVIDQQIQVLMLDGSPSWDTSFLQRSLMRNDKVNLNCVLQYSENKAHVICKRGDQQSFTIPENQDEFNRYDVILLGRKIDQILKPEQIALLQNYVHEHGGTVMFCKGAAFGKSTHELEPVIWDDALGESVQLQVSREGQVVAPFKLVADQNKSTEPPPPLFGSHRVKERKPLVAILAHTQESGATQASPAVVYRRYGQGQVLSVGVEGLWRWAFNVKIEEANSIFDRFWDQVLLWMMAGRDFFPEKQFSFRCHSANVLLGEKVFLKLVVRSTDSRIDTIPVTIYRGEREAGRIALSRGDGTSGRLVASFLPDKVGKYRAVVKLPDGSTQESKFVVLDENQEETEVATDLSYLKRLCESSGGRVLEPGELKQLGSELDQKQVDAAPKTRKVSLWDRAWIFLLIGFVFGADWWCRRRWGLC